MHFLQFLLQLCVAGIMVLKERTITSTTPTETYIIDRKLNYLHMKCFLPSILRFLAATLYLITCGREANAQTTFNIGPRVGLNLTTASYNGPAGSQFDYKTSPLSRFEAGFTADISRGNWALQPGLLYSQKGFVLDGLLQETSRYQGGIVRFEQTTLLNYLCLPVNLVYTRSINEHGFQLFGGGYLALLLGGQYTVQSTYQGSANAAFQAELPVRAGSNFQNDGYFYSRRLDAGVQAGIGYRYKGALVQLTYSAGLTNLEVVNPIYPPSKAPSYYSRALQASVTYLFKVNSFH